MPTPPRQPTFKEDVEEVFKLGKKFIPKSKPPRKRSNAFKAKKMAFSEETGRLEAERKAESKKTIPDRLREYFEQLLKNIDPLEAIAILGGTLIVHDVIFKMADFSIELKKVNPVVLGTSVFGGAMAGGPLLALFDAWASTQFASATQTEEQKKETEKLRKTLNNDLVLQVSIWLMAFTVAYIAIKHGDDLLAVAKSCFGMVSI